jgi:hypothetical protein
VTAMAIASNTQTKKLGLTMIIGYLLGLLFIALGFSTLSNSILQGVLFITAGLLLIPILWDVIKNKLNFEVSGVLKFVLFVILVAIGFSIKIVVK